MFGIIAWISLAIAISCSALIALDVRRHPQAMSIMNVVWPVSALYGSVFVLWAYFRVGRPNASDLRKPRTESNQQQTVKQAKHHPAFSEIAVAASHCGAGCTLGDIAADSVVFALSLKFWGSDLLTVFAIDYLFAWILGIAFQYFSIAPMQGLKLLPGIWAAVKADTLSITAWQVGMYGFMALTRYVFFPHPHLQPNQPQYWFMMQFAMIAGFVTAYPMNYVLVKNGVKEAMA